MPGKTSDGTTQSKLRPLGTEQLIKKAFLTSTRKRIALNPLFLDDEKLPEAERVAPPALTWLAEQLRSHLKLAGLTREALHTTDATRRAFRAQDARASTATWLGILMQLSDAGEERVGRRVEPFLIKDWLGHGDFWMSSASPDWMQVV